jgi:hypothetical protein
MNDMDELRAWLMALRTPASARLACASGWMRPRVIWDAC